MRILDLQGCRNYCEARQLRAAEFPDCHLYFDGAGTCAVYSGRWECGAGHGTAEMLMGVEGGATFGGALLQLTYAPFTDASQWTLYERVRRGFGAAAEGPGHLFEPGELADLQAVLGMFMDFGWDADVVPNGGKWFLRVSNEFIADVVVLDSCGVDAGWLAALTNCGFRRRDEWADAFCR
jgi:hypothetical protein